MQRIIRRFAAMVLLAAAALGVAGAARAQDGYPNHAVRWLVGYPPGGSTDICARLIGNYLSQALHQQFLIENRPGAGNNLATEMAAHSPPDGYTVFLVNPANAINATLYKNLPFDFLRDMAPVAGFIRVPNVMEVNPNVPADTVKEFIDYAKANPGKVNMASAGIGTSTHLSGALFMQMTGVKLVHVPYRGAGAGAGRYAGRPGAGVLRQSAVVDRLHQSRQAARAGGDHGGAFEGIARRADGRRDRAGLRSQRLVRHGGAGGHAARRSSRRSIARSTTRSPIRASRPSSPSSAAL